MLRARSHALSKAREKAQATINNKPNKKLTMTGKKTDLSIGLQGGTEVLT